MGTVKKIVKKWSIFDPTVVMVSSLPPYAVLVVVSKRKTRDWWLNGLPENRHTKVAGNKRCGIFHFGGKNKLSSLPETSIQVNFRKISSWNWKSPQMRAFSSFFDYYISGITRIERNRNSVGRNKCNIWWNHNFNSICRINIYINISNKWRW